MRRIRYLKSMRNKNKKKKLSARKISEISLTMVGGENFDGR